MHYGFLTVVRKRQSRRYRQRRGILRLGAIGSRNYGRIRTSTLCRRSRHLRVSVLGAKKFDGGKAVERMLKTTTAAEDALPVVTPEAAGLVVEHLELRRTDPVDTVDPTRDSERQAAAKVDLHRFGTCECQPRRDARRVGPMYLREGTADYGHRTATESTSECLFRAVELRFRGRGESKLLESTSGPS